MDRLDMDFFTTMEHLPQNLAVIGVEILLVVVFCLMLARVARVSMAHLVQIPALEAYHPH